MIRQTPPLTLNLNLKFVLCGELYTDPRGPEGHVFYLIDKTFPNNVLVMDPF